MCVNPGCARLVDSEDRMVVKEIVWPVECRKDSRMGFIPPHYTGWSRAERLLQTHTLIGQEVQLPFLIGQKLYLLSYQSMSL